MYTTWQVNASLPLVQVTNVKEVLPKVLIYRAIMYSNVLANVLAWYISTTAMQCTCTCMCVLYMYSILLSHELLKYTEIY